MFEVGDYVVHGNNGVCEVMEIGPVDFGSDQKEAKLYYTLRPCSTRSGSIFTPVDQQKVKVRDVMSREEAEALLDEMDSVETLWVGDEKRREAAYKEAFRSCDPRDLVKIIKTIYARRKVRLEKGKKVTTVDEKYFRMAENNLYEELAIALSLEKSKVMEYIMERMNKEKQIV
jgi:CarD family transcriptional regulator